MKTYQKVIIAILICGIAFVAVQWLRRGNEVAPKLKEPIPVEVVRAKSGPIARRINAVGDLSAIQSVKLHPEVTGKIVKIYFKEGENVKEGEPLFKIDDAMYKAKVHENEARVAFTQEEYNRAVKLIEKKFGTLSDRDKKLSELRMSEANLEEAKINLERTVIKAPFEGVMGLSKVSVGASVSSETELTTIVDLDPINIDFHIPESYLPFVHEGDEVDVTIEDYDILPVDAKITAISPEIDEATRTVTIRAQMPNKEHAYRPGEFARVLVVAGEIQNAVLIPESAVEREGEEEFAWVVTDNVAVKTTVSTGMRDGSQVEITHGIKADDVVISAGQFKVHDGEEVTIVNQPQEGAEEANKQ